MYSLQQMGNVTSFVWLHIFELCQCTSKKINDSELEQPLLQTESDSVKSISNTHGDKISTCQFSR